MSLKVRQIIVIFGPFILYFQSCRDAILTRLDAYSNTFLSFSGLIIPCLVGISETDDTDRLTVLILHLFQVSSICYVSKSLFLITYFSLLT